MLIAGVAAALWTASGYVGAFMRASNVIYEVEEGRSMHQAAPAADASHRWCSSCCWRWSLVALVLTGPLASKVGSAIGIGQHRSYGVEHREMAGVADRRDVHDRAALLRLTQREAAQSEIDLARRAMLAVVVWLVASAAFAFYVSNFASYNKTYGTLGGIIVFLVWMWITNVAILLGAEINAERERSRQLEDRVPGAERAIQLEERSEPKAHKRARTV